MCLAGLFSDDLCGKGREKIVPLFWFQLVLQIWLFSILIFSFSPCVSSDFFVQMTPEEKAAKKAAAELRRAMKPQVNRTNC